MHKNDETFAVDAAVAATATVLCWQWTKSTKLEMGSTSTSNNNYTERSDSICKTFYIDPKQIDQCDWECVCKCPDT